MYKKVYYIYLCIFLLLFTKLIVGIRLVVVLCITGGEGVTDGGGRGVERAEEDVEEGVEEDID